MISSMVILFKISFFKAILVMATVAMALFILPADVGAVCH